MSDNWNQNMRDVFVPGWVNCLDESMSPWFNRWTCPGFFFVLENRNNMVMNTTHAGAVYRK